LGNFGTESTIRYAAYPKPTNRPFFNGLPANVLSRNLFVQAAGAWRAAPPELCPPALGFKCTTEDSEVFLRTHVVAFAMPL
jgi:hypothetical protein